MRQYSLFPRKPRLFHGGDLVKGRRKELRPLCSRRPVHLVLKSKDSLRAHGTAISQETRRLARRFGLRLYGLAVASDHVHLLVNVPGRREYLAFIRSLTGLLARRLGRGLWTLLPFSRVACWGRDFTRLKGYLRKNREEAEGARPYEPRWDWYGRYRKPR